MHTVNVNYWIGGAIFLYGAFSSSVLWMIIGAGWLVWTYFWAAGKLKLPALYIWPFNKPVEATTAPVVKRGRGRPRKNKEATP